MYKGHHSQPHVSKKQWKASMAAEERRARLKLQKSQPAEAVSQEMVIDALVEAQNRRIHGMLPEFRNKLKKIFARNSMGQTQNIVSNAIRHLPGTVLKKHVSWMTAKQQDAKADISLTEEIELFSKYVGVSFNEL